MKFPNREKLGDLRFFFGKEVEKTCMEGRNTLFVMGRQPNQEIRDILLVRRDISHLYVIAMDIFDSALKYNDHRRYAAWEVYLDTVEMFLHDGFDVTLEFDIRDSARALSRAWCKHSSFIPMISVYSVHPDRFNANAIIRLTDPTFNGPNGGVWCAPLSKLTSSENFVPWSAYENDEAFQPPSSKESN